MDNEKKDTLSEQIEQLDKWNTLSVLNYASVKKANGCVEYKS